MKYPLLILLSMTSCLLWAQDYHLKKIELPASASFRGISVVDNQAVWISGNKGTIAFSSDGGDSWTITQVKGFENADFRSIYAFSATTAIIANAGSPAYILRTNDSGKNWIPVYHHPHKDAFFDGIDFWNENEGIIYGDPIDGRMLLLQTRNGGKTWQTVPDAPQLESGEASFAASGTGIRCFDKKKVMISTGGRKSRIWSSADQGATWTFTTTPIIQGENTTGIFSFAKNKKSLIIVGGDYLKETQTINHHFISTDGGKHWQMPARPTQGYRECIEPVSEYAFIAVGPSGVDISTDDGNNWKSLSDEKGLHVARKARKGTLVVLAGANGSVFRLTK